VSINLFKHQLSISFNQCRRSWGCRKSFGLNLLDLGEIWAKLRRNLGKIEAKFGKSD